METSQAPKQVAETLLTLLSSEIYKYLEEEDKEEGEKAVDTLENLACVIGMRLAERLTCGKARMVDQKEVVKFVCKDVWTCVFGKQADRLQTNRRGGYVIQDSCFRWIAKYSPVTLPPTQKLESDNKKMNGPITLACGIIRGALLNLGIECSVSAEILECPACSFSLKIPLPQQLNR